VLAAVQVVCTMLCQACARSVQACATIYARHLRVMDRLTVHRFNGLVGKCARRSVVNCARGDTRVGTSLIANPRSRDIDPCTRVVPLASNANDSNTTLSLREPLLRIESFHFSFAVG